MGLLGNAAGGVCDEQGGESQLLEPPLDPCVAISLRLPLPPRFRCGGECCWWPLGFAWWEWWLFSEV